MIETTEYREQHTEIVVEAGETTGTLTITAVSDSSDEDDETLILTPQTPVNATNGTDPITITITDDDDPPTASFAFSSDDIEENSSTDVTLTATAQDIW